MVIKIKIDMSWVWGEWLVRGRGKRMAVSISKTKKNTARRK